MAVVESSMGGYTPICNNCGVAICWDISPYEYGEARPFWDDYCCKDCNPNYKGALKRFMNKKSDTPLNIDRLLGQEVFLDEKKFYQYIDLFKRANISLHYQSEKNPYYPEHEFFWHARTLIGLLAKDNAIYLPDPKEFFDYLLKNSSEIESFVLDELFYENNSDEGEFSQLSTDEKIQDFISTLDEHSAKIFLNYRLDRNLFRLIEQHYGNWHFDE